MSRFRILSIAKLDSGYHFAIVDVIFTKTRTEKRVVSKALLIAGGSPSNVDCVISDSRRGLRDAIAKNLVGATW